MQAVSVYIHKVVFEMVSGMEIMSVYKYGSLVSINLNIHLSLNYLNVHVFLIYITF